MQGSLRGVMGTLLGAPASWEALGLTERSRDSFPENVKF